MESELKSILEKARKLDGDAVSELFRLYHPKLVKFMFYRVGGNDAEDLAGDVFVKLIRSIGKQSGNFEAWLYRIARNVIIDKVRKTNSKPETEMEREVAERIQDDRDDHHRIDNIMDIQMKLACLNDDHREFLTLKFIQGLDNSEISEITGKSVGALRVLQFRALSAMRKMKD